MASSWATSPAKNAGSKIDPRSGCKPAPDRCRSTRKRRVESAAGDVSCGWPCASKRSKPRWRRRISKYDQSRESRLGPPAFRTRSPAARSFSQVYRSSGRTPCLANRSSRP